MPRDSRADHKSSRVTLIVPSPFSNKKGFLRRPTRTERLALEEIYGAPIVIDGFDYAKKPRKISGLVVHLVENHAGLRDYQGDENFFDGRGKLYQQLLDNKWSEYKLISRVDPNAMPKSVLASTLVRQIGQTGPPTQTQLVQQLEDFFARVKKKFPDGAFIKYIREFGTREANGLIHTPEANAKKIADEFFSELKKIQSKLSPRQRRWLSPALLEAIGESRKSGLQLATFLLHDPKQIMVQERLNIALTRDGTLAEARVDFCSSGAFVANLRWGYDVDVDYKQRAMRHFQKLWRKFPKELQKLFGGADVVFLKNGNMKFIEFNFGGESGFLDPSQLIVPGNVFISKVLRRPTPLIAQLETIIRQNAKQQAIALAKLIPRVKRDDETHLSLRDLHLPDVFLYMRDRMIEEWLKNPSHEEARLLSARFRFLARSQQKRIKDSKVRQLLFDMARFGNEAMLEFLGKHCIKQKRPNNENVNKHANRCRAGRSLHIARTANAISRAAKADESIQPSRFAGEFFP